MEVQRERQRLLGIATHNPDDLRLPPVPNHDFHHAPHPPGDLTLPDLKTVLSPDFHRGPSMPPPFAARASPTSFASLPSIDGASLQPLTSRRSEDSAMISPLEADGAFGRDERPLRSTSVVSMDDPDVRIAAEALSGLGNPDYARSPPLLGTHVQSHASRGHAVQSHETRQEPEPLLELLMQRHPWVGGTINGSMSAYTTTKYYSPRLVQMGANLVERNIATPMANTVGSVGRMTGAESVARWYLTPQQAGDMSRVEGDEVRHKRQRLVDEDLESGPVSPRSGLRRDSQESRAESLPAYRASKPPSYREEQSPSRSVMAQRSNLRNLSSQIFVMTSGLGVALSVTSRRSLHFCINMLAQSAVHIQTVTNALKLVLEQYDQAREHWHQTNKSNNDIGERPQTPQHDQAARRLAEIIKKHSDDIWHTLQGVVKSVSTAAGGALPENARQFVRSQLLSLPQRWQFVSDGQTGESDTSRGAHRMVAFAMEGLDMIGQVSQVCRSTLDSAERWLERVGRRQAEGEARLTYRDDKETDMTDAPVEYAPVSEKQ